MNGQIQVNKIHKKLLLIKDRWSLIFIQRDIYIGKQRPKIWSINFHLLSKQLNK